MRVAAVAMCVCVSVGTLKGFFSNDECLWAPKFLCYPPIEIFYQSLSVLIVSNSWITPKVAKSNLGFLKASKPFLLDRLDKNLTWKFVDFFY